MKSFDFEVFINNTQKEFEIAYESILDVGQHLNFEIFTGKKLLDDLEYEISNENLIDSLNQIELNLKYAFESLGLQYMLKSLDEDLKQYKGKYNNLENYGYIDTFYSPVSLILKRYFNAIKSHNKKNVGNDYARSLLEQILKGTPKILFDRNIDPSSETEVKKEVYKILIHVFPDTVREIPIPKVTKTYKPDIGVKSLKSAIEYKFIDSESEAKYAIGSIFEDINCDEGSEDWNTFYAVLYMTDNYITQAQVEAEFKISKVTQSWKPIVVYGKGERKKKKN